MHGFEPVTCPDPLDSGLVRLRGDHQAACGGRILDRRRAGARSGRAPARPVRRRPAGSRSRSAARRSRPVRAPVGPDRAGRPHRRPGHAAPGPLLPPGQCHRPVEHRVRAVVVAGVPEDVGDHVIDQYVVHRRLEFRREPGQWRRATALARRERPVHDGVGQQRVRGPFGSAANHVVSRAGYRSTTTSAVDRSTAASTSASGVPAEAETDMRSIETPNRFAASTEGRMLSSPDSSASYQLIGVGSLANRSGLVISRRSEHVLGAVHRRAGGEASMWFIVAFPPVRRGAVPSAAQ